MNKIFIVAELSANHAGSIKNAIDTVKAAKNAGADAIKLQTYTPDTITLNSKNEDFQIKQNNAWQGMFLYDLYKDAYTPWEWHEQLFHIAEEEGLICFSTPFDETAVDFLETLHNPIYKIASFEINHIPLIKYVAKKKKPIILSTGMADINDIQLALKTIYQMNKKADVTLLKCTSSYPTPLSQTYLKDISWMQEKFQIPIGLSDHSKDVIAPIVSISLGAVMIEKHFMLEGIHSEDSHFSLNPKEFRAMVIAIRKTEQTLNTSDWNKNKNKQLIRSVYVYKDIKKGELFTIQNIKIIRPGYGLAPKFFEDILGKKSTQKIKAATALQKDMIEKFNAKNRVNS